MTMVRIYVKTSTSTVNVANHRAKGGWCDILLFLEKVLPNILLFDMPYPAKLIYKCAMCYKLTFFCGDKFAQNSRIHLTRKI